MYITTFPLLIYLFFFLIREGRCSPPPPLCSPLFKLGSFIYVFAFQKDF